MFVTSYILLNVSGLKEIVPSDELYNSNGKYLDGVLIVDTPFAIQNSFPKSDVKSENKLLWGAYVGDGINNLNNFEILVGRKIDLYADFEGWNNSFPLRLTTSVGEAGKTLIIFWEPNFGYDDIINGSKDGYIREFARDAKRYIFPVILVPFDEMNLNEEDWGYGQNNNTADKFKIAWRHIYNLFNDVPNVKFGLAYNNISIPMVEGNLFKDYYPGDQYVDYVGIDGFSFADNWQSFGEIFDVSMKYLVSYHKPIFIFSLASEKHPQKASWITEGLGSRVKTYENLAGWVWFNQGGSPDWRVNSDTLSLSAFKSVLP